MVKQKIIAVKFPKGLVALIRKISNERGECISTFVRRSVRKELARMGYLSESEKKALGFKTAYEIHMERKEKEGKEDVLK